MFGKHENEKICSYKHYSKIFWDALIGSFEMVKWIQLFTKKYVKTHGVLFLFSFQKVLTFGLKLF